MAGETDASYSESARVFAECFQTSLEALAKSVSRDGAGEPRLLFPRGISYFEFGISAPITARIIVSSDPISPKFGVAGAALVTSSTSEFPTAMLEGEYGVDFELDPDVEEEAGRAEALAGAIDWRPAESMLALRDQINARFPGRSKASDGILGDIRHCGGGAPKTSDHCPWVRDGSKGVVTAIDITNDPAHGCVSEAIAQALIAGRDPRIKYVISNRKIAASYPAGGKPAWTWRPYNGDNPHNKHFHLSVLPDKALYDSRASWTL